MLPQGLIALGAYEQFIVCPYSFEMRCANPWTSYDAAANAAETLGDKYGIAFALTENDPFFCLDIDDCLENGIWSPLAISICQMLPGAAIEVSKSGRGLRIWGRGQIGPHACKNIKFKLELYHRQHYIILGHSNVIGDASTDCSSFLPALIDQYFPSSVSPVASFEWTVAPCEAWIGPDDDDELIQQMLADKPSAFSSNVSAHDLWEADASALAKIYPSISQHQSYGESEADAALAQHLAFWTGRNCERMARLLKRSGLARPKYEREDYIRRTILHACEDSHSAVLSIAGG
jgi:primase-polymerase (primpol)-like protein